MEAGLHVVLFVLLGIQCAGAQQFAIVGREALPRDGSTPLPTKAALVDLDGDGALDIVFAGTRYYHNDGRGRFTARPLVVPSSSRVFAATGDFDGDGDLDVLMSGGVLENRGAAGPVFVPGNLASGVLAVGRIDGDLRDDLVLQDATPRIALATSLSTFAPTLLTGAGADVSGAAIADLDGDGDGDIVWATSTTTVNTWPWGTITYPGYDYITWNKGNGVFAPAVRFPNTPDDRTVDVVALDADGDGDVDCGFLSGPSSGALAWRFWRNQGGGRFAPWSGLPLDPQPLEVSDLDRDGDPDLVGSTSWYENVAGGRFVPRPIQLEQWPLFALGDVDGDADVDLLFGPIDLPPYAANRELRLLLDQGAQQFVDATAFAWQLGQAGWWGGAADVFLRGDLDGDGLSDLLGRDGVLWRAGSDGWHEAKQLQVSSPRLLADLDADGDLDLWSPPFAWLNSGAGAFVSVRPTMTSNLSPGWAFDVDGDGDTDLLDVGYGLTVLRNQGALVFSSLPTLVLPSAPGAWAVADFDGDADLDVLLGFATGSRAIELFVNNGSGAFAPAPVAVVGASGPPVYRLAIADLDGDGDPDVLAGSGCGAQVQHMVLRNTAGVLVADPTAVPGHSACGEVALGDLDADGDVDAVVDVQTTPAGLERVWWRNDGTGRFTFEERLDLPRIIDRAQLFDVDQDGDADLLASGRLHMNRHRHLETPFLAQVGTAYTLRCGGRGTPNALALPCFGWPATVPIPGLGTLRLDPATAVALPFLQLQGEMGEASFLIPANAALAGVQFGVQALLLSGGALHLTPHKYEIVRS